MTECTLRTRPAAADYTCVIVRYARSGPHGFLVERGEYVVLALSASYNAKDPFTFMIHLPDDAGAFDWGWFPVEQFEIVLNALPGDWIYDQNQYGFDLVPAAWRRTGHWDDLEPSELDRRPPDVKLAAMRRAWADYQRERDQILREAGRPPGYQGLPGPSCPLPADWRQRLEERPPAS
jgi:hypothetical protein